MSARKIVTSYLLVQSLATGLWWALLFFFPQSVEWFQPSDWPDNALLGFWLGDFLLIVVGSAFAAYVVCVRKSWAHVAVWSVTAAAWYPTLYCIGVSLLTGQVWLTSALMVSMSGLMLAMATIYGHSGQLPATFRVTTMSRTTAMAWTIAQLLVFWSTFLWILPRGIVELERRFDVPGFNAGPQELSMAIILFSVASFLGFSSCVAMAMFGDGTPLPTATAPKLVISGPYRFVRNPMALAGILQGIAVSWMLGSYGAMAYCILGGFTWHLVVRPVEEKDLDERFGEGYQQYKRSVGLWIPYRKRLKS